MTYRASLGRRASEKHRKAIRASRKRPQFRSIATFMASDPVPWIYCEVAFADGTGSAKPTRRGSDFNQWMMEQWAEDAWDKAKALMSGLWLPPPTVDEVADWAYGNAVLSNPNVTRDMAMDAARKLLGEE